MPGTALRQTFSRPENVDSQVMTVVGTVHGLGVSRVRTRCAG